MKSRSFWRPVIYSALLSTLAVALMLGVLTTQEAEGAKDATGELVTELSGLEIVASAARTGTGNSGDLNLSDLLETGAVCDRFGVVIDITVQGGTQASIDFDLEGKYAGKYVRLSRYNSVPGDGVVAQLLVPNVGTKPLPVGGSAELIPIPDVYRLAWTFNTPGATPTVTFSAHAVAAASRNRRWAHVR